LILICHGLIAVCSKNDHKNLTAQTRRALLLFLDVDNLLLRYSPIGICSLVSGNILKMKGVEVLIQKLGLYFVSIVSTISLHGMQLHRSDHYFFSGDKPYPKI